MLKKTDYNFLKNVNHYLVGFILLIIVRLYLIIKIPLMDKTEARYANIARIMAEINDWIVVQIDYGVPFWAKPPLSTWVSALSLSIFGNSEWAVRLPYLIVSILLALWISKYSNHKNNYFSAFVLFSIPEFYLHSGVVSTDLMLSMSIALIMLSFWEIIINKKSKWNYGLFIAIGLGLLSKGPISLALTLPPILLWAIHFKMMKEILFKLWWVRGILISLIIALPWYLLVELNSPGFYDYFIIGEHFQRYFDSGWSGDKYGRPKQQVLGIIWVFLILLTLPWIILLIRKIFKEFKNMLSNKWQMFLLYWIFWTPFLFTFSKSLIHPYIMPVMVPIALLIADFWNSVKWKKWYYGFSLGLPILLLIIHLSGTVDDVYYNNSDKLFIDKNKTENLPLFTLNKKSYSSQFYSEGKVKLITEKELNKIIIAGDQFQILISQKDLQQLPHEIKNHLETVLESKSKGLYRFINN